MRTLVKTASVMMAGLMSADLAYAGSDVRVEKDIAYLSSDRAEKMDAYLPPDSFKRPVPAVLLIHGGGWRVGDKADRRERNIGTELAANGYAVFSINYLLNVGTRVQGEQGEESKITLTKVAWPQNIYDCKTALRFIRKESARFGVDAGRIVVMGGSAGGHLAMLLGCTADVEALNRGGLYTEQRNDVKGIINFYGIPDVAGRRAYVFAGKTDAETAENVRVASPTTYFHKSQPPMLIAHGTADKIVPVETSRDLAKQLQALGAECDYVEIPGAPHTFDLQVKQVDIKTKVLEFLKKQLGGS